MLPITKSKPSFFVKRHLLKEIKTFFDLCCTLKNWSLSLFLISSISWFFRAVSILQKKKKKKHWQRCLSKTGKSSADLNMQSVPSFSFYNQIFLWESNVGIIVKNFHTHSDTGFRWKGQRRGVFSICWTDAGGRPGEAGGSLQAALLQVPRAPPQCEPPLDGCLEGMDRGGAWLGFGPPPPPGFGAFCMALERARDKSAVDGVYNF